MTNPNTLIERLRKRAMLTPKKNHEALLLEAANALEQSLHPPEGDRVEAVARAKCRIQDARDDLNLAIQELIDVQLIDVVASTGGGSVTGDRVGERSLVKRLTDTLADFLDNDQFQVAVGGNPIAVDQMLERTKKVFLEAKAFLNSAAVASLAEKPLTHISGEDISRIVVSEPCTATALREAEHELERCRSRFEHLQYTADAVDVAHTLTKVRAALSGEGGVCPSCSGFGYYLVEESDERVPCKECLSANTGEKGEDC